MPGENSSETRFPAQCDLLLSRAFHHAEEKFFRAILYSSSMATFLLVANAIPAQSKDDAKYISEFLALNPTRKHEQFRGKIVNVLYSCIIGRSSSKSDICKNIENNLKYINNIKFIKSLNQDQYAVNFLVTHRNYPKSILYSYFEGCGKMISGQTVVIVGDEIKENMINRCINISTLNHLGFNVSSLVFSADSDIDIDKLISLYIK